MRITPVRTMYFCMGTENEGWPDLAVEEEYSQSLSAAEREATRPPHAPEALQSGKSLVIGYSAPAGPPGWRPPRVWARSGGTLPAHLQRPVEGMLADNRRSHDRWQVQHIRARSKSSTISSHASQSCHRARSTIAAAATSGRRKKRCIAPLQISRGIASFPNSWTNRKAVSACRKSPTAASGFVIKRSSTLASPFCSREDQIPPQHAVVGRHENHPPAAQSTLPAASGWHCDRRASSPVPTRGHKNLCELPAHWDRPSSAAWTPLATRRRPVPPHRNGAWPNSKYASSASSGFEMLEILGRSRPIA